MTFRPTLKTPPTLEPVTLAEAKLHCKVDLTTEDDYITGLIVAARRYCEHMTGRAFVTQTWYLRGDYFPDKIVIPFPKLQSVSSISYIDTDGVTQTLAATEYTVDAYREPGTIVEAYDKSWPTTRDVDNCVTIEYVCGYGATAASVPEGIRHAIKMLVAHWHSARQPVIVGTIVAYTPIAVDAILSQYNHGWQFS